MQANRSLWTEIRGHRRVADVLVETLQQAGADRVFALPAESLNPIIDALRKQDRIRLVTVRHEGAAALMASAYGKLTGRLGVCMGAAGPGASHLPVGTYDARADRAPLVAVSGQVPVRDIGWQSFQEIDSLALFRDSTSFNRLVASPQQTGLIALACAHSLFAKTAVHIGFPSDVLAARAEGGPPAHLPPAWLQPQAVVATELLARAAAHLSDHGDAVVVLGAVTAEIRRDVEEVADRLRSPILLLPEGIHYLREHPEHPLLRITDRPDDPATELLRSASRVLVVGSIGPRGASLIAGGPPAVHLAPSSEIAWPPHPGVLRLVGSLDQLLQRLAELVHGGGDGGLLRRAEGLVAPGRAAAPEADLWTALDDALPPDATLSLEPGPLLSSAFLHLPVRQRTITSSFGRGARGYAVPGAMAAALARPASRPVAVATPGGLVETMAELLTAKKYGLDVKVVCLAGVGVEGDPPIDIAGVARACGIEAHLASDALSLAARLAEGQATSGPSVLCLPPPRPPRAPTPSAAAPRGASLAAAILEALVRAGVTRVYGAHRPPLEALRSALEEDGRVKFIGVVQPESAAMMASAYGKWTGRPGVCVAGDEQDLVFQLNGLYDAAFDHTPLVLLSEGGEELLADVAQASVPLRADDRAASTLAFALAEAARRRGVIHLSVDWPSLSRPVAAPRGLALLAQPEPLLPAPALLDEAVRRLLGARRLAILVGRGAQGARPEIEELVQRLASPVVATMPGRGVLPDEHPCFAGGIGASGHPSAVTTVETCDVLLALGVSRRGSVFGMRGDFFLIQVDRDPLQLGRNGARSLGLAGSVKETLPELIQRLRGAEPAPEDAGRGAARSRYLRQRQRQFARWVQKADRVRSSKRRPIRPPAICHALRRVLSELGKKAVLVTDVGVTTLWVYRHLVGDHDRIWTSSFATMGFALPAAIAIGELEPDRVVVALAGDGGVAMTMAELATAAALEVPIVVVVFDNGKLAAIKYEQEVMGWPEYGTSLLNCDFAEFARACGARGSRVEEPPQLESRLREALRGGGPFLLDVVCDPHEMPAPPKIHPLQAAGYALAQFREAPAHVRQWLHALRTRGGRRGPRGAVETEAPAPKSAGMGARGHSGA